MVRNQLLKKARVRVGEQVIIANPRAHKDLFHPRHRLYPPQQLGIFAVVYLEVLARGGRQAFPVCADPFGALQSAGGRTKVGGRSAHVVDIPLEIRQAGNQLRLRDHTLHAPRADLPPLVKGDGAEVTRPKATPVVGNGKAHLLDGGHPAPAFVVGVIGACVRQRVDRIQLRPLQGRHGRILHHQPLAVRLCHHPPRDRVGVLVLHAEGVGIRPPALLELLKLRGEERLSVLLPFPGFGNIYRPAHVTDTFDRHPAVKQPGNPPDSLLPHAVTEQVGTTINQNTAAHPVVPIVIVGKAAQRCLQPPEDEGHVPIRLPDPVAVDNDRAVRAQPHLPARRIVVIPAPLFRRRIVRHHGVDIPGRHQKPEPRPAEPAKILTAPKVRLRQHRHPKPGSLQHARDDGGAKRGVVDIRVPAHKDKISLPPAPRQHILPRHR